MGSFKNRESLKAGTNAKDPGTILGTKVCKHQNNNILQWKHTYVKAVNKFWSKQLVSEIKTKKSVKYLPVDNLRIGSTRLVWRSLDSTVSDVRKGVTKARILTGTYLLQKKQQFIQWWNSRSGMPPLSIRG